MGNFKQIGESHSIDGRFVRRVIVYLESREDYEVFCERWFPEQGEWLEFRATDACECSGGCTQVENLVERDRGAGIVAFGVLDRDALLRALKWDAFWERDDDKYQSLRPCGDHIRLLCRWEMENYLLDPEELERIIADFPKPRRESRSLRPLTETIKELLRYCEVLIPVMGANIFLHQNGEKALDQGLHLNIKDRFQMEQRIKEQISKRNLPANSEKQMNRYTHKVEDFAEGHPDGSPERWESLNRIVDGKRLLNLFLTNYKLKDEYRYALARNIKERNRVPDEIRQLIEWLKKHHTAS